ncbi:MAG TPA: tetratricopeptide repeat protein [Terriglobales bacterium]
MSVPILRVCNGMIRRQAFTSSDGSFSFTVGDRASDTLTDASEDPRDVSNMGQTAINSTMLAAQNNSQSPIADCELRTELTGYASTAIRLDQTMANSNVGIIMLHNRAKKSDGMVSVASLEVPTKARKEYEKGSELLEKGDFPGAEKCLQKAIELYPRFAEAWLRSGDLEQRRKNPERAVEDYQQAINADPNFPLPYLRMAYISAVSRDWEQTRRLTERLITLDPVNFPLAYYYNAAAELNLKHLDKAETNALRAEAMDKQHAEPTVELLLAAVYSAKGSYSSAADHYREFLKLVPEGPLSQRVKTDLAQTEQLAKSQAPSPPAANK